jgi:hypothetical protein
MDITDRRSAVGWRQSQQSRVRREGRDSCVGFVSGGGAVPVAYPSQDQIAAAHETLGPIQKMSNLCAHFAVGRPPRAHDVGTEQNFGNVAMAGAGLRRIKRVNRAKMQQRSASRRTGSRWWHRTTNCAGRGPIPGQARPQMRIKRHGETVGCAVFQCNGQRGSKAVRPMHGRNDQLRACVGKALLSWNLPEAEGFPSRRFVCADGTHPQQFVSAGGPERMRLARVELRVFHEIASPNGLPRCCAARGAHLTNPRNTPGGAAGTPTQARGRLGRGCTGTLRRHATTRMCDRCWGRSSWQQLPSVFEGRCHGSGESM